jgi:photosystem II stability/assembly factor-like uncharacterized protein
MSSRRNSIVPACLLLAFLLTLSPGVSASAASPDMLDAVLAGLSYRALGPYRAGSWVTCFAVPETPPKDHLYTYYVGARNGGLWKTVNGGTTFEPVFDGHDYLSIGAVALAPSDPNTVWLGTGEAYNARSSHRGDGVYKSTDAGKTWTFMGLRDSQHIVRIIVHPRDADTVYVAAMGHLFTPNAERGLFKTTDGGKTWSKVLYINENVGVIDLALNRSNPDILYAATYEKYRRAWTFEQGGPASGIYKSTDAGATWKKLAGGLPTGKIGRIGLDIFDKNPDILCALVENANPRPATKEELEREKRFGRPAAEYVVGSSLYRSDDAGATWTRKSPENQDLSGKAAYSFNMVRMDPNNDAKVYITGVALGVSSDSGKTWVNLDWPPATFATMFGDVRTVWIDPQNSDRLLVGSDGGVHVTYDAGKTVDHFNNLPLGEWYAIGLDMADPYNIYGGLQDHDSWKGPSNGWSGEVTISDWVTVGEGDGMYNVVDWETGRWVYNCREFGNHTRLDQKLGVLERIAPRRPTGQPALRYNWVVPIAMSPHNPEVIYTGAQVLFRSAFRGDGWQEISPDLTTNDPLKIHGQNNVTFCTITTVAESAVTPGLLWVGTDDGKVWITRDGGGRWTDVTPNLAKAGAPAELWVSRVLPSARFEGTAYAAKTGFRVDDSRPYLYKTTDFGATWTAVTAGLPPFCVNVVVEDRKNPDLLFCGTDGGVWVSIDAGKSWTAFKSNMPSIPVNDLQIHPRENDLVAATYGRGLYIADISPLQELTAAALAEDVHVFDIRPKAQHDYYSLGSNYKLLGDREPATPNEPDDIMVHYYLKSALEDKVKVTVSELSGETVKTLEGKFEAGFQTVTWGLDRQGKPGEEPPSYGPWRANRVDPGTYVVTVEAGGRKFTKKAVIRERRGWSVGPFPARIK